MLKSVLSCWAVQKASEEYHSKAKKSGFLGIGTTSGFYVVTD